MTLAQQRLAAFCKALHHVPMHKRTRRLTLMAWNYAKVMHPDAGNRTPSRAVIAVR